MSLKPWSELSRSQQQRRLRRGIVEDTRGRHSNHRRGKEHPRWNDGLSHDPRGYIRVRVGKTHPMADPNGYCYIHDLVAVGALGRSLEPEELVHHFGARWDNRWEMLKVETRTDHLHHAGGERNVITGRFERRAAAGK